MKRILALMLAVLLLCSAALADVLTEGEMIAAMMQAAENMRTHAAIPGFAELFVWGDDLIEHVRSYAAAGELLGYELYLLDVDKMAEAAGYTMPENAILRENRMINLANGTVNSCINAAGADVTVAISVLTESGSLQGTLEQPVVLLLKYQDAPAVVGVFVPCARGVSYRVCFLPMGLEQNLRAALFASQATQVWTGQMTQRDAIVLEMADVLRQSAADTAWFEINGLGALGHRLGESYFAGHSALKELRVYRVHTDALLDQTLAEAPEVAAMLPFIEQRIVGSVTNLLVGQFSSSDVLAASMFCAVSAAWPSVQRGEWLYLLDNNDGADILVSVLDNGETMDCYACFMEGDTMDETSELVQLMLERIR